MTELNKLARLVITDAPKLSAALPKNENAVIALAAAKKSKNPSEAGDKSWLFEIAGMREAQIPKTAPLMLKIDATANLLFLVIFTVC